MTDLTESLRAQGIGWSDSEVWPIEKRAASQKMIAAADMIEAVLEIHRMVVIHDPYDYTGQNSFPTCAECYEQEWPCPTVVLLTKDTSHD